MTSEMQPTIDPGLNFDAMMQQQLMQHEADFAVRDAVDAMHRMGNHLGTLSLDDAQPDFAQHYLGTLQETNLATPTLTREGNVEVFAWQQQQREAEAGLAAQAAAADHAAREVAKSFMDDDEDSDQLVGAGR